LWDWTALNASFDRGIRLCDIDGFVEVNNRFLFIEGKPDGIIRERGQRMALERLANQPRHTVVILAGAPPATVRAWQIIGGRRHIGTMDEFVAWVRLWFEAADAGMEME
jgi:hypothetical protein